MLTLVSKIVKGMQPEYETCSISDNPLQYVERSGRRTQGVRTSSINAYADGVPFLLIVGHLASCWFEAKFAWYTSAEGMPNTL